jgi:hypothetical protein
METEQNFAMISVPTLAERFWRRIGFGVIADPPTPPKAENMLGWAVSDTVICFSFSDRLRLLIGGRLRIWATHHTDTVVNEMVTTTRLTLPAPGARP